MEAKGFLATPMPLSRTCLVAESLESFFIVWAERAEGFFVSWFSKASHDMHMYEIRSFEQDDDRVNYIFNFQMRQYERQFNNYFIMW